MVQTPSPKEKLKFMRERRDSKVYEHLIQYAPVWMVQEDPAPEEDAVQFNIVFRHPQYGWVNRRYNYDSFNNVLYYMGQVVIDESEAYDLQDTDPYIQAATTNTVNSYGG